MEIKRKIVGIYFLLGIINSISCKADNEMIDSSTNFTLNGQINTYRITDKNAYFVSELGDLIKIEFETLSIDTFKLNVNIFPDIVEDINYQRFYYITNNNTLSCSNYNGKINWSRSNFLSPYNLYMQDGFLVVTDFIGVHFLNLNTGEEISSIQNDIGVSSCISYFNTENGAIITGLTRSSLDGIYFSMSIFSKELKLQKDLPVSQEFLNHTFLVNDTIICETNNEIKIYDGAGALIFNMNTTSPTFIFENKIISQDGNNIIVRTLSGAIRDSLLVNGYKLYIFKNLFPYLVKNGKYYNVNLSNGDILVNKELTEHFNSKTLIGVNRRFLVWKKYDRLNNKTYIYIEHLE